MQVVVRAKDGSVFEVNKNTLEPISKSYLDPESFSKPKSGVWYMSLSEWVSITESAPPPRGRGKTVSRLKPRPEST
jgi:hypothetical protein